MVKLILTHLFGPFEAELRAAFERAKTAAGESATDVTLEIADRALDGKINAEFAALPDARRIRVTWNGIASLWASSQGFARLSRRMFDGTRAKLERLEIPAGSELERGLFLLELSRRLSKSDLRFGANSEPEWMPWAPRPEANANNEDDLTGNRFLLGAFAWILRHELAHIVLGHGAPEVGETTTLGYEQQADAKATEWLKGPLESDPARLPGQNPAKEELELEARGIFMGIAILWIGLYEKHVGIRAVTHPPVAERLFECFDRLGLARDSAAAEIIAHSIQVWIDPQGGWSNPETPFQNSSEFLTEAAIKLQRYMAG